MDRLVYILALIIGILYTVRKLEAQRQDAQAYPNVAPAVFEAWREQAVRAYSIGSWSCFLTMAVRTLWMFVVAKTPMPAPLAALVGLSIDLAWVGSLGYAMYASHLARRTQRTHGIFPQTRQPVNENADADDVDDAP